jgi:hypothetical protein
VAARYQQTGVGDPSGRLVGKAALRAYFEEALQKLKDVRLDLQVSELDCEQLHSALQL